MDKSKNIVCPWTHTAVTKAEFSTSCDGYPVTVPAGTLCRKLDGGSEPWVVGDLSFIEDKNSMLYFDADHRGIRIPEENLVNIYPVGLPRDEIKDGLASMIDARKEIISNAIRSGASQVERGDHGDGMSATSFLRGRDAEGKYIVFILTGVVELAYAEDLLAKHKQDQSISNKPSVRNESPSCDM